MSPTVKQRDGAAAKVTRSSAKLKNVVARFFQTIEPCSMRRCLKSCPNDRTVFRNDALRSRAD